ncbi:MAG: hypothetical protein AAF602_06745 [Myxococcota bacterium]
MATALLLALFGAPAHADDLPENQVGYQLGDGLRFELDNGTHTFRIGGFVQPSWQPTIAGETFDQILVVKRSQFLIDGALEDDSILFEVLTDFSLNQPLLNAWLGYRFGDGLTISAGQRQTPANLREMTYNEGYLSFPERSLVSRTFSETGREFGLFLDAEIPIGEARIRPSVAVTSGDGRNSFGVDSRDVDRGGFKWGGRIDLLPLGDFAEGNRGTVTDLAHESSPKFVIGGAFSFNDGASGRNGEGHDEFELFAEDPFEEGEFIRQQPDYSKINADIVFKWQGFSLLGEYVTTSAAGLQNTFTDPVGGNPLFTGQISQFLVLGSGINAQVGYHFDFGLGVDARYSMLTDDFPDFGESQLQDATAAGAAVTAFLRDHDLKVQLAGSRVQVEGADAVIVGELLAHLRF